MIKNQKSSIICHLTDEQLIRNFDWNGNNPDRWVDSANALINSYNLLYKEYKESIKKHEIMWEEMRRKGITTCTLQSDPFSMLNVALMLSGYAIECLLKAIWVKKGNPLARNGKFEDTLGCKSHNLKKIAEKVGVDLNEDEEWLLVRLSEAITSFGRYPIGKKINTEFFGLKWGLDDGAKVKKFVDLLWNLLGFNAID